MGRPREFDDTLALDAAVECFWRRGYEATSVRELAAQMGICGTSLYNAYGDKRALFEQALERYLDRSTRVRMRRLEATHAPRAAIGAFFEEIIIRSLADRERRGCFLINSAMEVAPHDPKLGVVIADRLGEIETFFRRCILAARAGHDRVATSAQDPQDDDPQAADLARLLLACCWASACLRAPSPTATCWKGSRAPHSLY